MHGENSMAIKCMSMFGFILGLKMNTRFLFHHSSNPTDASSFARPSDMYIWMDLYEIFWKIYSCMINFQPQLKALT